MPDHAVDEETLIRRHSLCLYGVPGITSTSNRRCENCPGAARTPQFHQRRCPLDSPNEPNLFTQAAAAQAGKSDDPKLLASSSNAVVPTTPCRDHDIESASGVPRLNTPSPATARSVSYPPVEVNGRKRKAGDRSESVPRNEENDFHVQKLVKACGSLSIGHKHVQTENEGIRLSGHQLDGRTDVRDSLRNKEVVVFPDPPSAPIEYNGINPSQIASSCCITHLMFELEFDRTSDEEQRKE